MADQNPDPATLTDEELDKILNPDGGDEKEEKKPAEDPEKTDNQEENPEDQQQAEEEKEEDSEEEQKKPSRREQLRIQQILEKYGDPETGKKPSTPKVDDALDYEKELEADEETIKRLREDREGYGSKLYQQGLEQAKSIQWHTRLEIDAPRIESKYPQLDKSSEEFNPMLADSINRMYLSAVGFDAEKDTVQNPSIRYAEYVESMFELAEEMSNRKVAETRNNIAKQAANTGLRPDGSGVKKSLNLNKSPQDMTDEELDAYIDKMVPKR